MTGGAEPAPGRLFLFACATIFLAALVLRVLLLFGFPGNFDSESFGISAGIAGHGGSVYSETRRYNYSPAWAGVLLVLDWARKAVNLDLVRAVGFFLIAADLATAWLLFLLARDRFGPSRSILAALLFFANPVSILISSFHGQFDNVAILFLVAAILVSRHGEDRGPLTLASLSASLCVKHIAWFHPLLFAWRRGRRFSYAAATIPYAVFLASFLPYWSSWRSISHNVFAYRGLSGNYGLEALQLLFPSMPLDVLTGLLLLAVGIALACLTSVDILRASLILFLVQVVFAPGFARQYTAWPVALGALFPSPAYALYTLVSAGFLVREMSGFGSAPAWLPGWYGPWWAAVAWLLWETRAAIRQKRLATGGRPVALSSAAGVRP